MKIVRLGNSWILFFKKSVWRVGWFALAAVVLAGCAAPCTYKGKAVPAADAARMRSLGMDVVCP